MIVKEKELIAATSPQEKAGVEAEKQMAFYLKREFAKDADIFVFNDLRHCCPVKELAARK